MLRFMDRSTIHYLKQKGWSNTQIAEFMGYHRDTIARVLREAVDRAPAPRQRTSAVAVFDHKIPLWIDQQLPVTRMLELARADPDHPYQGGPTAFFDFIRAFRRQQGLLPSAVPLRFEGLPGEFLQIDWGEQRNFPFTSPSPSLKGVTRYFFAARLKYSRFMFVQFTNNMREETLLRCLIACFRAIGGVPWVVTTDNMKTVVLDRDTNNQPIWHPSYLKLAVEFGFHPEACAPASGNQKGAVENLVKFVQTNFLAGRSFHDDADLSREQNDWLQLVNEVRPSAATEQIPAMLLGEEQHRFGTLPASATDYGFFDSLIVGRESLVMIETNRYSVPVQYIGQVVTARIHLEHIELFVGSERVATHPRHTGRRTRIINPEHFEPVFERKPRGRVMVYRDWLVAQAPSIADYVAVICQKRRDEMAVQIIALYELVQRLGLADMRSALELAAGRQLYGVEYVQAIATTIAEQRREVTRTIPLTLQKAAESPLMGSTGTGTGSSKSVLVGVERSLASYEEYVANWAELRANLVDLVEVSHEQ
jgi:transposase